MGHLHPTLRFNKNRGRGGFMAKTPKIAVIYYSQTGHIHRLAKMIADEMDKSGAEVRLRRVSETAPSSAVQSNAAWAAHQAATKNIPEVTSSDMEWADGYVFGSPTRFGNMAAQVKSFIDTLGGLWFSGKLSNKTVTSFTSAQNPHGGQESTILSMNNVFYHWGCVIIPPGYTDSSVFEGGGNPYGTSMTAPNKDLTVPSGVEKAIRHQGRRLVQMTLKLAP